MSNMSENSQCILYKKTKRGPLTERERIGRNVFLFCGVSCVGSTVASSMDTAAQGQLYLTWFLSGFRKYLKHIQRMLFE